MGLRVSLVGFKFRWQGSRSSWRGSRKTPVLVVLGGCWVFLGFHWVFECDPGLYRGCSVVRYRWWSGSILGSSEATRLGSFQSVFKGLHVVGSRGFQGYLKLCSLSLSWSQHLLGCLRASVGGWITLFMSRFWYAWWFSFTEFRESLIHS